MNNNKQVGLTVYLTSGYYLINIENIKGFFEEIQREDQLESALELISTYNPDEQVVLFDPDSEMPVKLVNKNQKPSLEVIAEQLDWSINKLQAFIYLVNNACLDDTTRIMGISGDEYDLALSLVI
jgi:hypothetical protein